MPDLQPALDFGGAVSGWEGAEDPVQGRMATIVDPFGAEFSVIARPPG